MAATVAGHGGGRRGRPRGRGALCPRRSSATWGCRRCRSCRMASACLTLRNPSLACSQVIECLPDGPTVYCHSCVL